MTDEDLLDDQLLEGLQTRPIGEVRTLRARCVETETGLSYLRRLVQGSLDIADREVARRSGGRDPAEVSDIVGELPEILGDTGRSAASGGRLPMALVPGHVDEALTARYEDLVGDGRLTRVNELHAVDLADLIEQLGSLEREISDRRRAFHARIDALGAEIARRYRTGQTTVDELLAEGS